MEFLKACTVFYRIFIRMLGHFNTFHMFPAVQTYHPLQYRMPGEIICCLAKIQFSGKSNTLLPESLPLPEKRANIEAGESRVFLVTVPVLLKGGSRDWIIAYHYIARFESKLHQNWLHQIDLNTSWYHHMLITMWFLTRRHISLKIISTGQTFSHVRWHAKRF